MQDRVLGRQALAALATAIGDHAATADGSHTSAEAVTAGANQLAGLISAFHGANSENQEVRCIRSCLCRVNLPLMVFLRKGIMVWNPDIYLKFADHRLRPALDLLGRIDMENPSRVFDLGCGAGNVTRFLLQRWPQAMVTGIDSSAEMLGRAGRDFPQIHWRQADIGSWQPEIPAELIYSNAALQWLDGHDRLLPALFRALAPGGVLAVQMPRNFAQPSHVLMRQVAEKGRWAAKLAPHLREDPVAAPAEYWRLLQPLGATLDIWETEYLQDLSGDDAVLHWMSGTSLRPLLDALEGEEKNDFADEYRHLLAQAYPMESGGTTLFPFRRLFMLVRRAIL